MHTIERGDQLELSFYNYLLAQQKREEAIYGTYIHNQCNIRWKPRYYCKYREGEVEFDIVVEVYRNGAELPHTHVVFECKNYKNNIPEIYVNDLSSKLSRIFKHSARGIFVVSSRLQSGAEKTAKNSGMGIAKFDENGLDVILERKGGIGIENFSLRNQLIDTDEKSKPLKFSAIYNDRFYGSLSDLLTGLVPSLQSKPPLRDQNPATAPFVSDTDIASAVNDLLLKGNYQAGEVDLTKICDQISVELSFQDEDQWDSHGNEILGHADFERRIISVNRHENKHRERFTIAHEIGHFCLEHDRYLRSEPVIRSDFFKEDENESKFDYDRLEIQANKFASHLLMPDTAFRMKVREIRRTLDLRNRGYGDVYVDDQPGNQQAYWELLNRLSTHFNVSKQAVELRLKNTIGVTDKRTRGGWSSISDEIKAPLGGKSN
ncbi:ImmA/IrrE family metallo-endopeptidase [Nitratireductor sp. L1-7-SE]|uniref:ImmA/IrrE family metallo-endopeptidase n=1 Tax=Nitratireductor rhodophyticola TaxID=2854036 RepID=A0ABS7R9V4_9HYPH|nr:ImmA/IrrE family metallo-endopeptidase [Nitratireductor rhodophyticola]MBY8917439.1 ImmA/IrrE family metallo-endopeptidase [Nitratireductor rhodophyticola]MBY8922150.1 ImmA/IrrE family metallo-endopeptidase [Nitratireductor rhodophyticola]